MRRFTREELAACNGRNGAPAYVAFAGKVYDVSRSFLWQRGRHQVTHPAGADYTGDLRGAPHGPDLLERFPVVGILAGDARSAASDPAPSLEVQEQLEAERPRAEGRLHGAGSEASRQTLRHEAMAAATAPVLKAVCRSEQRSKPKTDVGEGELRPGWGLVGDSHAGPARPGRWEISLLAWENVEQLNREHGLDAVSGSFAENLTTLGLDTSSLRVGDRLAIGGQVVLEVQQLGKPPEIAHTYSFRGYSLLPYVGVFCRVLTGGWVRRGDPIRAERTSS